MRLSPSLCIALVLLSPGAARAQTTLRHPNPQYIRVPDVAASAAKLTDPANAPPFHLGVKLGSFGSEGDPDSLLLGDIREARLLPSGGAAILDDKLTRLRIFSTTGQPQQSLGRLGGGPGEFVREVFAMATDPAGDLFIADLSRGLKIFTRDASGYRYSKWLSLEFSPQAICLLGSTIVAVGLRPGSPEVLHTFDPKGVRLHDFGVVYESPNLGLNYQYNRGPVACDPVRPVVYFAVSGGFGDVRAYQADGTILWRTAIDGFQVNIVEETRNGYTVRPSPEGVHRVQSLVLLPRVGLLLQVGHRTTKDLEDGTRFSTLTSFLLDPVSGHPTPLGTTLPLILAGDTARLLLAGEDPVPYFELRAWTAP